MRTSYRQRVAETLASAFLAGPAGEWTAGWLAARGCQALGAHHAWLPALARRTRRAFREPPIHAFDRLVRFIAKDREVAAIAFAHPEAPRIRRTLARPVAMARGDDVRATWELPLLDAPGDVARWLELTPTELDWLADRRGLERLVPAKVQHYTYRWVRKPAGGARLLEAPKPRLKALQRRILHEILDRVPPHDAAHSLRIGRNVVTHAAPHAGRDVVLRMDLADFFLSIPVARVSAMFRTFGYAAETARTLAGLCTNRAPTRGLPPLPELPSALEIAALHRARQRYGTPHLPQGAPTSPALANLAAFGMDVRMTAAAASVGAVYTRYADDLVFSGDGPFAARAGRFQTLIAAIALEEGFSVNHRKTRVMHRGVRQSITGLVVNGKPAIARGAYERIEATLFNCARRGPASQNREGHAGFQAHLRGLIAWVASVQPERAARLDELFGEIDFDLTS